MSENIALVSNDRLGNGDSYRVIAPGDIVRLKTGGPDMTVESISGEDCINCVWFGYDNVINKASISAKGLIVILDYRLTTT